MAVKRFALISDTHGAVHPSLHEMLRGVHTVLHAGDVGGENVLMELGLHCSVIAVAGNVDGTGPNLPLQRVVDLPFGKAALAHGHLVPPGRETVARHLFETFEPHGTRLIVTGHSHLPALQYRKGSYLVNPGSAGRPRFGAGASLCMMDWDEETDLFRFDFRPLDWSR